MRITVLTLISLLLIIASPIAAQDFNKGLAAAQAGNWTTALKEWKPLAEDGDSAAQYNLVVMYDNGDGVPQDYKEGIKWYTLAAEKDVAKAQSNLGFMYGNGRGVLKDNVIAHMWYNIGAANGDEISGENKDITAKNMTSEDISKAQAMARECMNSNYQDCGY